MGEEIKRMDDPFSLVTNGIFSILPIDLPGIAYNGCMNKLMRRER